MFGTIIIKDLPSNILEYFDLNNDIDIKLIMGFIQNEIFEEQITLGTNVRFLMESILDCNYV